MDQAELTALIAADIEANARDDSAFGFARKLKGPIQALGSSLAMAAREQEVRQVSDIARLLYQAVAAALAVSCEAPIDLGMSRTAELARKKIEYAIWAMGARDPAALTPERLEAQAELRACGAALQDFVGSQRGKAPYSPADLGIPPRIRFVATNRAAAARRACAER